MSLKARFFPLIVKNYPDGRYIYNRHDRIRIRENKINYIGRDQNPHKVPQYEGKGCDKKTDIWALGCILYEMACLQKTFEGSSLPALINKIVKGKYDPVKRIYSVRFQKLIGDMLQRDPCLRPHAHEIQAEVGELIAKNRSSRYEFDLMSNEYSTGAIMLTTQIYKQAKHWRSIVFQVDLNHSSIHLTRLNLNFGEKIAEFAKSSNHFLVLTQGSRVYSWGNSKNGKLGLGEVNVDHITKPTLINELSGRSVFKVVAGEEFSIFGCRNGLVLSCGLASSCCLGQEMEENINSPTIINDLLAHSIVDICCGPRHVLALTDEGNVLSWGENFHGQLGHFEEPITVQIPKIIHFPDHVIIRKIFTGIDASMFLDDQDNLWACGSNNFNKLGLNKTSLFKRIFFTRIYAPKCVGNWRQEKVRSVALTSETSTLLLEDGSIIMFGQSNAFQLTNKSKIRCCFESSLNRIDRSCENSVTKIQQSNDFILAQTYENQIYFWGVREVNENLTNHDKESSTGSNNFEADDAIRVGEPNKSLMNLVELLGPDYPVLLVKDPQVILQNSKHLALLSVSENRVRKDFILKPQVILALYSSHVNLRFGEIIEISNVYCFNDRKVYVIIDTTIPPPKKLQPKKQRTRSSCKQSSILPVVMEEGSYSSSVNPIRSLKNSASHMNSEVNIGKNTFFVERGGKQINNGLISWTFPPNGPMVRNREREEELMREVGRLKAKLRENQRKLDEYKGLIEELEDRFNRIRRRKRGLTACTTC